MTLTTQELAAHTAAVRTIAASVAAFIAQENGKVSPAAIEHKHLNDLVSYVDKEAERQLVQQLSEVLPQATFVTEEDTVENEQSEYYWVIDPLDGTTNFLHSIPHFCISVALVHHRRVLLGVIYDVTRQECFWAYRGGGAFLNEGRIAVSTAARLLDAVLGIGFPYRRYGNMAAVAASLEYFLKHTQGLRRMGSAALDLAYVAAGRFDAFYEVNLNAWDVAAGIVIVEEAGGTVQDFAGTDGALFGKEIIASNPQLAAELLQKVQQFYVVEGRG